MGTLGDSWPDPDRRDAALLRCLVAVHRAEPPGVLSPQQTRVLEFASRGLDCREIADALGLSYEATKSHMKLARRVLRAKNTTHACCEAIRALLIH